MVAETEKDSAGAGGNGAGESGAGETGAAKPASAETSQSNSIASAIKGFGAILVGLVLLLAGVGVVIPDEAGSNATMLALGALMAALGAGIVATVLLPHSIEVGGDKVKPFGMDVKASGGAAVFLVALAFVYFSNAQGAEQTAQPETSAPEAQASADPGANTQAGEAESRDDQPEVAVEQEPGPSATPSQVPQIEPAAPASASYYYAETFCSECCRDRNFCDFVGFGEGSTPELAAQRAVQECQRTGGGYTCANNVIVNLVEPDDF